METPDNFIVYLEERGFKDSSIEENKERMCVKRIRNFDITVALDYANEHMRITRSIIPDGVASVEGVTLYNNWLSLAALKQVIETL